MRYYVLLLFGKHNIDNSLYIYMSKYAEIIEDREKKDRNTG